MIWLWVYLAGAAVTFVLCFALESHTHDDPGDASLFAPLVASVFWPLFYLASLGIWIGRRLKGAD